MALVLLTGPRCALILYLGLGCSAAGLPIEKLVSRARRLSANACATETTAWVACAGTATIGDDDYWTTTDDGDDGDDDDFSPTSCDDVQTLLTSLCDAGPTVCQAEYHTYLECLYEYMTTENYGNTLLVFCEFTCSLVDGTDNAAAGVVTQAADHALCFAECDLVDRGVVGGMDATLMGTATCEKGLAGLVCDGSDGSYADLNDVALGGAMSIEVWVRLDTLDSSSIFDFNSGPDTHEIALHGSVSSMNVDVETADDSVGFGFGIQPPVTPGTWTHLVFTTEGTYKDGRPVTMLTTTVPPLLTRKNHYLCKSRTTNKQVAGGNLEGAIASLRIWSRARSREEIEAMYTSGPCESWPSPAPTISPLPSPLPTTPSDVVSSARATGTLRDAHKAAWCGCVVYVLVGLLAPRP